MTSLTDQAPVRAGTPAHRSLMALIPVSLLYTLLWPVAAAKSPHVFRVLGRRAWRRLVMAFAPRAAQRRSRVRPPAERPQVGREPSQSLPRIPTTAMTVAIVDGWEARWDATTVVDRLAHLAVNDELVVVCGSNDHRPGPHAPLLTAGLRQRLPRHDVVALHIAAHTAAHTGEARRDAAVVEEFLEIGSLPIVVTPTATVHEVATRLARHLNADRVLRVSCTTGGADVFHVWPGPASFDTKPTCLAG
jgi:hypothetical protein